MALPQASSTLQVVPFPHILWYLQVGLGFRGLRFGSYVNLQDR